MVKVREDLTGKKFGRLLVLRQTEDYIYPSGQRKAQWICKCDCGNEIVVVGHHLKEMKSCGCYKSELLSQNQKKYNMYDLSGEYGIGYTSKQEEFWFDLDDYDLIKNYCWYYSDSGYVMAYDTNNHKYIRLHQLIMNTLNTEYDVDHKIHPPQSEHKLDNRKSNLRIVTRSKNLMNSSLRSNNTSGITGVCWNKALKKWLSRITVNGTVISLGHYSDFESAVCARKNAEIKYFGDYRYDKYNKNK